jgi:hypothetical protein
MKKLLIVVGVAAFSFGVMSCKKECKCTLDGKDVPLVGTVDTKDLCDQFQAAQNLLQAAIPDAPKVSCEWK